MGFSHENGSCITAKECSRIIGSGNFYTERWREVEFIEPTKKDKYIIPFGYNEGDTLPDLKSGKKGSRWWFSPHYTKFLMDNFEELLDLICEGETTAKYGYILKAFARDVKNGHQGTSKTDVTGLETGFKRYPTYQDFQNASVSELSDIRTFSRGIAKDLKEFVTEWWDER